MESVFAGGDACGNHRSQSRHPPPQTCPKLGRVGRAETRAAVEVSASKTAAGEAAASEDLEEASATAADGVATTAATEGASKTPHEGVAARAAVGRAAASAAADGAADAAADGAADAAAADGEGPKAVAVVRTDPL